MNPRLLSYITVFALVAVFSFWQTGTNDFAYTLIFYLLSFAIVVIGYAFAVNALSVFRTLRYQNDPGEILITDISHRGLNIPSIGHDLDKKLRNAGFVRSGELEVTMPYFPSTINYEYVLGNGDISATLTGTGQHYYVRFFTLYNDESLLETFHPLGFDIEAPILRSRIIKNSFDLALAFHQHQMGIFGNEHGEVRPLPDIQSLTDGNSERLMKFTLIRSKHVLKRVQRALLVTGMALVILLPTWFHLRTVQHLDMSTLLGMIAAVAVAGLLMWYLTQKENELYADKRKFQKNQA